MIRLIQVLALSLSLLVFLQAKAEDALDYRPPTASFSGKGALLLPFANVLNINGAGTIEFWVSAQWEGKLEYDPAIIAYAGPEGPRFAVHLASNAKGIGIYAGEYFEGVQYDFTDGALHYVAIVTTGDFIDIYIDGIFQRTLGYGFADLPATTFSIGSYSDRAAFIGEIGQVRIWNEPIDQDTLNKFALIPLLAQGPDAHPDIQALVAMSTFANPNSNGFMVVEGEGEPNLTERVDQNFDDGVMTPVKAE